MTEPIFIRPRLLARLAKWAYQHDDRLWLRVVRIGDGELVVTDGHRAVIMPVDMHGLAPFGIHTRDAMAIAAVHQEVGNKHNDVAITVVDKVLRVEICKGVTLEMPARDVSGYPPYKQIIPAPPKTPQPDTYTFNARYLAAIDEVIREHPDCPGEPGVKCVAWSAIGDDGICGPMMFESLGMKFIIMPQRASR